MKAEGHQTADGGSKHVVPSSENLIEANLTEQTLEDAEFQRKEQGGLGVQKNISVIFATIGGFETPSHASMDEIEEAHIRKNHLDIVLDRIISKYGGVIDKIIRNFFMATFGTKVANQDTPACAVLAALEMVEAIQNFPGAEVHIGINSGPAWVGIIGTGGAKGFTDATVIGDTVNLAARLKSKAETNQIVVSPATYHLTQHLFAYESLCPVILKGIADPVPIYAVRGKKGEVERITAVKETEEERQKRLQEAIPPHLREKINATRGSIEGERRLVTMLYSDLSGFTALSEKFKSDPGKIAQLIDMCHRALGEIIYKYEGVIDQIVGDQLMAIFGAPIVHEDDPERAIGAGLEMLEAIKRFSDRMKTDMGTPPLNIHIGVNTGRVSIGNISTDATAKMDYTVIGEPVELAEKLEDISEAGEIVVGERTYRLTRALFDYEPLKPVDVSGRLIPIYKVLGKKATPQLKRGVAALNRVNMVARQQEFDALKAAASHLLEGTGHFVCIMGQAGLGKSRLKRELKALVGEKVLWLEGNCFEHTQRTAYSVFISAMKGYLGIHDNESDEEITEKLIFKVKNLFRHVALNPAPFRESSTCGVEQSDLQGVEAGGDLSEEIIPYLGSQLLSLHFEGERGDKIRYLDAEGRKRRADAAMRDVLVAESKRRPVVLALEDLHWLDEVSLELIFFLMETVIDRPLLLLCLYRPDLTDLCWQIGEQAAVRIPDHLTQIHVSPLSPEASRALLEGLLTLENAEALKRQILEKADGNPFYMEEVLRALIDDKVIAKANPDQPDNLRWILLRDVQEINVPDTLEQMLGARIDKLLDESKAILQRSAVIGYTFGDDILQDICWEFQDLDEPLSRLMAMDMVKLKMPPTHPPEYMFEHVITHHIAYSSIPSVRRRHLHTQVGDCMATKHQTNPERMYEQLAQHYHKGHDVKKAVIYLAKAGTKAKRQYNHNAALAFYQQGLEHLNQLREDLPEERIEMYEGVGDVYTILGEFDAAVENYRKLQQNVRAPLRCAVLKRKIANLHEKRAEYDAAMETLNSALDDLKEQPDFEEEARIYNAIGWIHAQKGEFDAAIECATRALKRVENRVAYDVIAAIEKNLGSYYQRTGNVVRGKEYYTRAIKLADQIGDKMLMAQVYLNLGTIETDMTGQMDIALENYQKGLYLFEQLGYAVGAMKSYGNLGIVYSKRGEFDSALEYFDKALTIARRTGAQDTAAQIQSWMGTLCWRREDYDRAAEHYLASLEIRQRIGNAAGVAECYVNLVDACLGRGDVETAERYAIKGVDAAQNIHIPKLIAGAYKNLGLVKKHKKELDEAMKYFQKAAEIANNAGAKPELASAYRFIGEVSLELQNIEGAKEFFQKAIVLFEQLKSRQNVEQVKALLQRCERG